MSRGKRTAPEQIMSIMAVWAVTGNYSETARSLSLPQKTVEKIVKENKDKPEFISLCKKKREEFTKKADIIISKALNRLEKEIDEAENIPINHLTTVIGTLFDKVQLAKGKATNNVGVEIKIPSTDIEKLADIAGYKKK